MIELAALFIAMGGLAIILSARRLGLWFLAFGCAIPFLPLLGAAGPIAIIVGVTLLIVVIVLSASRAFLRAAVGRHAGDEAAGELAADAVRFMLAAPFRVIGALFGIGAHRPRRRRRH